jgi:hypothetical protein
MGSQVALVKGNHHMEFQVDRAAHFFVLVKGGRQMGSQVDRATHSLVLVKGGC